MAILGASNSFGAILGPLMVAALTFRGHAVPDVRRRLPHGRRRSRRDEGAQGAGASPARTRRPRDLRPTDPRLRPFMLMWFVFFLTFSSVQITTGFFIQDRLGVTDQAGVVRIASFCLVSMARGDHRGAGAWCSRRCASARSCCCGCVARRSPSALLDDVAGGQRATLMAGFAILGLAFACATPGINGGASMAVEPHQQGTASGYLAAANTVGAICRPAGRDVALPDRADGGDVRRRDAVRGRQHLRVDRRGFRAALTHGFAPRLRCFSSACTPLR